jgi:peptide subunit release factor 1 (eRF1)
MTTMPALLIQTDPVDALRQLSLLEPGRDWIVSCYLPIDRARRLRGGYLTDLRQRMHAVIERLPEDQDAVLRDFERIEIALADARSLPGTPGLAVFACEARDLLMLVPLPRVHRARVIVDRAPRLRELRAVEREFGRVIVALIDRVRGRLFEVTAGHAEELPGIPPHATRGGRFHSERGDSPGGGEKEYHHRITKERERHYEAFAARLRDLSRGLVMRGMVVAGSQREVAGLLPFLDDSLRQRLVGTARLNVGTATLAQVRELAFQLCAEHERTTARAEVERLLDKAGEGWAVNGVQATTRALARGQLRTLVVRGDTDAAEADEAIEEALHQDVPVVMVDDPEAGGKIAQLGGFLRFR